MSHEVRTGPPHGRLKAAQRRRQVLNLAMAGVTEEEIGTQLGITKNRVSKIINDALDRWAEQDQAEIEKVRTLQLRRLDRMLQALWPDAIGVREDGSRKPASLKAIAEVRKLEIVRANIVGTLAAKRVEVAGSVALELPREEVEQMERAWVEGSGEELPSLELEPGEIPEAELVR